MYALEGGVIMRRTGGAGEHWLMGGGPPAGGVPG